MLLYKLIDLKIKMQAHMADRDRLSAVKGEDDLEVLKMDEEIYKQIYSYQELLTEHSR